MAQPFAHQTSFWCPNGTKIGLVWENFSNFQPNNLSQNHLDFILPSCSIAEQLYHQADPTVNPTLSTV